ncbi:hypothetical protein RCH16_000421 [Cryobacterium sp. MP_M5]|uniref:WbqC family protein n=1 Tax=unclassified Cryobacterium TaxID=2649013 RepID=UPI0018C98901|nr:MULTISPECIES: WbqC family protein [unclassified Cryobacterium]MBG6057229.1 hypothetical protein [Cryobacterium sp. MP_M3]MEC5175428.1 hypothetical protein [Cryobacterium sp. MP_M5]
MPTVSVHQPNFMPWSKLLAKVLASDVFVAYDSVQFTRKEFHARQLFRTRAGKPEWLSVPVQSTGDRQVLKDARIAESLDWRSDHLRFLRTHYGDTPFFGEVFPLIENIYARRHTMLVDLNLDLIETLCRYLAADVRIVRARDLPHSGDREQRLLDLVQGAGGDAHLTSTSTTHHIDWSGFERTGIPVFEQVFTEPVYPQPTGDFVPHLAAADLLFACGPAAGPMLAGHTRFERIGADSSAADLLGSELLGSELLGSDLLTGPLGAS